MACLLGMCGTGMFMALLWCSAVGEMIVVKTVDMAAMAAWLPWTGLVRWTLELDDRATSLLLARRAFIA